ncbi:XK-related protein 6-like [Anthonomus grandis grandis]|uniref:XK-related protein 6-like n=1 Tax=Anthonomus grandis grandis TaxID=2921223 RepID=UPI0021652CBB|nr:XK-related protein 6-like [Anthonomus grandis grandis]
MAEFLPLCDLLFNVVSLAVYFCDLVFDLLVVYALCRNGFTLFLAQCLMSIGLTMLICQVVSFKWYLSKKPRILLQAIVLGLHVCQLGILWRYARLLVPVDISSVKKEVRDLCILRLVHGFLQAAPMLLLQLSLLTDSNNSLGVPRDLVTVSAALSLFSVCWSLASFSKHVQSVDRLVLTWLGVVSQLFWRTGTITSRAIALSAYAATYHSWIFLVLLLHWSCMFLWLLSPRSPFHGQRGRRLWTCALVAAIYVLAYINLQGKPHGRTMAIFYVVMLLENCLLVGAWLGASWYARPQNWQLVPILNLSLFFAGLFFMLLYYRYFHIRRLIEKPAAPSATSGGGVFNCRFVGGPNSASSPLYRKKKKPTTFVPPPPPSTDAQGLGGPVSVPFWRIRPLPSSSENEGSSVGSRVNIHQKLQEKKQKQLAELKIIEEEIKQGKLVGPENADFEDRQPIPRAKKHVEPHLLSLASLNNLASYGVNLNRRPPPRAPRIRTPELLLTPRYLYCDCVGGSAGGGGSGGVGGNGGGGVNSPAIGGGEMGVAVVGGGAAVVSVGSDLESQVSLPRSYTLPREFKYYRRQRLGRAVQPVASTNSSDGDVDSSADDDSENGGDKSRPSHPPLTALMPRPLRRPPYRHETQL